MAFIQQIPQPFTRERINSVIPGQRGVYGLFRKESWIYVGKGDIRERLLAHVGGDNPGILKYQPTHWVGEVMQGDPSEREKQLIVELQPLCNKKVG